MRFDESVGIACPPDDVFALLADVQEQAVYPGSPIAEMEKIPRGPTSVGTRWREVVRLGPGMRMTMWSEVTALEPGTRLAERFWGGSMRGTLVYTVTPDEGHALLRQQEHLSAVGWLRPFDRLIGRMLRPRVHRRLLEIKSLLEGRAEIPHRKEAVMRKSFVRIPMIVLGGIVGGYFGYWIGHLAGWSTNAEWPFSIGGGEGAIVMSIGMALLGVLLTGLAMALPPILTARRLLRTGRPAPATIVEFVDTGLASSLGETRSQIEFELDVQLDDGTVQRVRALQWVRFADLRGLGPGREVMVRYDPARPGRVAIERFAPAPVEPVT